MVYSSVADYSYAICHEDAVEKGLMHPEMHPWYSAYSTQGQRLLAHSPHHPYPVGRKSAPPQRHKLSPKNSKQFIDVQDMTSSCLT